MLLPSLRPSRRGRFVLVVLLTVALPSLTLLATHRPAPDAQPPTPRLELQPGDHICVIGNTLADRMQHDGWLETLLHARFPKHQLTYRDLGFSGDELTLRLRSADFGSPDQWLTKCQADVVFACFGYNESFAGPAGLDKFKKDLADFIKHTLSQKYNGRSAPRLVLVSPIGHENLKDPNLPDGTENNKRLELYTRAMGEVARAHNVVFVDVHGASQLLYHQSRTPLTINGVHLTEEGNRQIALVIGSELFGPGGWGDTKSLDKLRRAILDKNFYWFNR